MNQQTIKTAPIYVSEEDYNDYTGRNLSEELNGNSTPLRFLRDAEDDIIRYINLQSWRPMSHFIKAGFLTDEQLYSMKTAILEQADYMLFNGDAFKNSGLDSEGKRLNRDDLVASAISQRAIDILMTSGVMTLVMHGRR